MNELHDSPTLSPGRLLGGPVVRFVQVHGLEKDGLSTFQIDPSLPVGDERIRPYPGGPEAHASRASRIRERLDPKVLSQLAERCRRQHSVAKLVAELVAQHTAEVYDERVQASVLEGGLSAIDLSLPHFKPLKNKKVLTIKITIR